jgi:predicted RNase H-like HicB family nuclease
VAGCFQGGSEVAARLKRVRYGPDMTSMIEPHTDHLTIQYTQNEDGWITAQIEEIPAAVSQGSTQAEAYQNVLDALHDLTHEPTSLERLAYTLQARVVEPVAALLHR